MIGLSKLTDGGHVLEHPAGPLYVTVRAGKIKRAELALWGSPYIVTWPKSVPRPFPAPLPARLRAKAREVTAAD